MSSDSDDSDCEDTSVSKETKSNIPNFTLDTKNPQIVTLVGAPRTGKTTLLRSILYRYAYQDRFFKFGIVYSPNDDDSLREWLDERLIISKYSDEALLNYIERLRSKQTAKRRELEKAGSKKKYNLPPNFLVLDDVAYKMNWWGSAINQSSSISDWLARFRKTNTWVFLTSQYLAQGSSTALREYSRIFAFFAQETIQAMSAAHRAAGGMYKKQEFYGILKDATNRPFTALVVDGDRPPEERFFCFKCELPPEGWKITFSKEERARHQQGKQEHGNSSAQNATNQNNILNVIDSAVARYRAGSRQ